MGLDAIIYVEGFTSEQFAKADEFFAERITILRPGDWGDEPPGALTRRSSYSPERAELNTLERYYGIGYERGDWPGIYGAIRALQHLFPDGKVFYGSDVDDDGRECSAEHLDMLWGHWLSPDGDAYRRH